MRKKLKKIIFLTTILALVIIVKPVISNAGLQANINGESLHTKTASEFFTLIKGMETGTVGKSTINASDGIDCHMAKNTEWGGVVLLAACADFGEVPEGKTENSTTGNASGIYQMAGGKYEYTAHYISSTTSADVTDIKNALDKYKNTYENSSSRIDGDALNLGVNSGDWRENVPVVARGYDSLFGYYGNNPPNGRYMFGLSGKGGAAFAAVSSRAAITNGSGI